MLQAHSFSPASVFNGLGISGPCREGGASSSARCKATSTYTVDQATNIQWFEGAVPRQAKENLLGQRGCVLWFTGLSGSGKSTVACTLDHALAKRQKLTTVLDGDNVRHGLNKNLGFSPADRAENIRRIGEMAKLLCETGLITIVAFISPYREDRQKVRERLAPGEFVEIFMKVPLAVCETRDPKGLYKAARAGKIKGFTGIDDPYEEPESPEIVLDVVDGAGRCRSPQDMADQVVEYLDRHGFLRCSEDGRCGGPAAEEEPIAAHAQS